LFLGRRSLNVLEKPTVRLRRFKLDRDDIWQTACSSSKCASTDRQSWISDMTSH